MSSEFVVGVLGLGYVGLPLALVSSKHFKTIGFDINERKLDDLRAGHDETNMLTKEALLASEMELTSDEMSLAPANIYIITVPTPLKKDNNPDLELILAAARTIAKTISKGNVVVLESTVFPGVTENILGAEIEAISGLESGKDFKLGYSPERINPGDTEHLVERTVKVISGQDRETLEQLEQLYGTLIKAPLFKATSIMVAEASKVVENSQRDINIGFINEVARICDAIGISTSDVLEAAETKWNFLPFKPGLVGGHCIGVDPYYLASKAESYGLNPQIILAGRRVNESMSGFLAQKLVKTLGKTDIALNAARVAVLGLTYKPDVPDFRNSKALTFVENLKSYGIHPFLFDPFYKPSLVPHDLTDDVHAEIAEDSEPFDAIIFLVGHTNYKKSWDKLTNTHLKKGGAVFDVQGIVDQTKLPKTTKYLTF